ncbi:MAG: lectin-like protein [Planctomycetota bacterium]
MRASLFALSAMFATSLSPAQSYTWHQCPATGKVYAVTQPVTWHQARTLAQIAGGDLAVITSAAEHDWLYATFGGVDTLWIGYTDEVAEGQWRWVGNSQPTYTNWAPNNPSFPAPLSNWGDVVRGGGRRALDRSLERGAVPRHRRDRPRRRRARGGRR